MTPVHRPRHHRCCVCCHTQTSTPLPSTVPVCPPTLCGLSLPPHPCRPRPSISKSSVARIGHPSDGSTPKPPTLSPPPVCAPSSCPAGRFPPGTPTPAPTRAAQFSAPPWVLCKQCYANLACLPFSPSPNEIDPTPSRFAKRSSPNPGCSPAPFPRTRLHGPSSSGRTIFAGIPRGPWSTHCSRRP